MTDAPSTTTAVPLPAPVPEQAPMSTGAKCCSDHECEVDTKKEGGKKEKVKEKKDKKDKKDKDDGDEKKAKKKDKSKGEKK